MRPFGDSRTRGRRRVFARVAAVWCAWALSGAGFGPGPLAARQQEVEQEIPAAERPPFARVIAVELPLTGVADQRVKSQVSQFLSDAPADGPRPILVLEFRQAPEDRQNEATEFERAYALARYLSSDALSRVRTIAFIPARVSGHAILAVMACEEIAMAPDAVLESGDLPAADAQDVVMQQAYQAIAKRRLTIPPSLAAGVLDRALELSRVETSNGVQYMQAEELRQAREQNLVNAVETVKRAGEPLRLEGEYLRLKLRLVSHLAADRKGLAQALKLAPDALTADPSLVAGWRAASIDLHGLITGKNTANVQRSIQDAVQRGEANLIFLRLDSPGGNLEISQQLAAMLAELDPTRVRTVAVVDHEARADAALIALACDELVMSPSALLGGPGATVASESQLEAVRPALRQLAERKNRDWSLLTSMVDRDLSVFRYEPASGGAVRYLCDEEHASLDNPGDWRQGALIPTRAGIEGPRAVELGLAKAAVASFQEAVALFQIDSEVQPLKDSWVASRLEYLASQPWFSNTLLFVAFFALISEASAPGIGVPGFISALCFLLFFWAQFLNGTADWLEVVLFLAGVVFVALELLALPGFGVFGLGGIVMIIASIVLASQTFVVPGNTYQWQQQTWSLLTLLIGLCGLFVGAVAMRNLLPHTPWLRHLLLKPPESEELDTRERIARFDHLLHQQGVAITPLAPTGKARFGDTIVSVQTEGELLERGQAVQVAAVQGNRVVVRRG